MIRIGITGQSGFIGSHLYHTLGLSPNQYERILFEDYYFQNEEKLENFVCNCDVIVHLAAMNRHNNPQVIYDTNIGLVRMLISTMEKTNSTPHVIFASSIQEEKDNLYGRSKKEGRALLADWAKRNNSLFSGLIIPNVFGPFGNPYYNSFIATFAYQLTHGENPKIENDSNVNLIYVGELVAQIINIINSKEGRIEEQIKHTSEKKVSEILDLLEIYKNEYFEKGTFPKISNAFEINLFNTFRSYINLNLFFPFLLKLNEDNRGIFVEVLKAGIGGQFSYSTTKPGITRGNHFHTRKIERFAVIKGEAKIEMRRIGTQEKISFLLSERSPGFVDMPIWYSHNITNIGDAELVTLFWINEFYDPNDPDTYYEVV